MSVGCDKGATATEGVSILRWTGIVSALEGVEIVELRFLNVKMISNNTTADMTQPA